MTQRILAVLCVLVILTGVPLLWHKMSWQPPTGCFWAVTEKCEIVLIVYGESSFMVHTGKILHDYPACPISIDYDENRIMDVIPERTFP